MWIELAWVAAMIGTFIAGVHVVFLTLEWLEDEEEPNDAD